MRVLVDTNVLLFAISEPERLGASRSAALADTDNTVIVSSVSVAEILIKQTIGKLSKAVRVGRNELESYGFLLLSFTPEHAAGMAGLPLYHRDPFDRMLIAQAVVENLAIMTTDRVFAEYPVQLVPR